MIVLWGRRLHVSRLEKQAARTGFPGAWRLFSLGMAGDCGIMNTHQMKVLVTGFEPFGGESVNPAWEAVSLLQTVPIEGVQLHVQQLPVEFGVSIERLRDRIRELRPDAVISVGQAGGRADISVERVAINVDDARIPDNAGRQPIDEPIVPGGPAAYWSSLPIKAIVAQLRENGIPASVSQTAGTYVCNHLFYGLAHLIATECPSMRGGFIHIPYMPEQAAHHPGAPSMSLETIVRALQIAAVTIFEYSADIVSAEGSTH